MVSDTKDYILHLLVYAPKQQLQNISLLVLLPFQYLPAYGILLQYMYIESKYSSIPLYLIRKLIIVLVAVVRQRKTSVRLTCK